MRPVHEDLTAKHPEGQAKFLESALNEEAAVVVERLAERIDLSNSGGRSEPSKKSN